MRAVKRPEHRPVEIFADESGRHRFRVRARNGRVLASSQTYAGRSGARKGAAALCRVLQQVAKAGDSLVNEEKSCSRTSS